MFSRLSRIGLPLLVLVGAFACDDSKTTTSPGALASVSFSAPDSVRSGQAFQVDVSALTVGVNSVQNARVDVTLPAPLAVNSLSSSSGTSATFVNGNGATVSWVIGSLDSNSQSRLHIMILGILPAGSAAQSLTLNAMMTADGIRPGDAVAHATVQLMP